MSMHFAPQWAKPVKPTGSSLASNTEAPLQQRSTATAAAPASPFPALGQPRAASPTTAVTSNPPLSYSRVTHTPASPSYAGEGYFPYAGDAPNGGGDGGPPFRYSREQILAVWDEDKFKDRPIELVKMAESGGVLVSKDIVKPQGLRELSELEKRVTAPGRENAGPQQPNGRAGFGGFGRGEGGAFGGAKLSGSIAEGRQPGGLGGGFGGVGKRAPRRDGGAEDSARTSAASTWRPARTASGTFEGVLGFGGTGNAAPRPEATDPAADRLTNGKPEDDRSGWAAGQRKWRAAPQDDKLEVHAEEIRSESVIATASGTPLVERDAMLRESTPRPASAASSLPPQEREDLGAINWYYRDPNGQEQGPFTGTQMHEWYSHSYFKDDLPVRRQPETGYHTLAELKTATGNAVQPFLSSVRPPRLPPNLPIPIATLQASGAVGGLPSPSGLNDSFRNLNVHGVPPQPQFHQSPSFPAPYGQPQFNGAQAFLGGQQGWGQAPGPQSPARLNGAYGSIGGTQYAPYASPIGAPVPRADVFGGGQIGQAGGWGAPPINPAAAWQQSQVPVHAPAPIHHPAPVEQHPVPTHEPYFSPQEPTAPIPEPELETFAAEEQYEEEETVEEVEIEDDSYIDEEEVSHLVEEESFTEPELEPEVAESPKAAPASVWGQKTPKSASRKSSITTPASAAPAPLSNLPPAPASLSANPVAAKVEEPKPATPVAEKAAAAAPKPAPWADKPSHATGPSLREIQEAEARQADKRKQALADARAASSSPAPIVPSANDDHFPASLSWGLPQQGSKTAPAPVQPAASPAPAWGGASDGPKKTLKQIQEEEEKRSAKLAAQTRAAQAAVSGPSVAKRGYADLAANSAASAAAAQAAAAAGWTTVGTSGKASVAPPKPAVAAPKPVAATVVKPINPIVASKATKPNGASKLGDEQPTIEFIRWTKQALTGLRTDVNVDEFIQMLLQFPVDPPASSRADVLEIIADSVYAASSTLDGRHFAQEFFTRRKADAARSAAAASAARPVQKIASLADVVKTQPKPVAADAGFKVVKTKKGRKL
ncbi:GYF domain-containing protein mpd2 [Vanrija pseudolonga]|uniref:GYF domain-containing protein mpd2 n=1 Tax=Vanrija pseudolonga TaxID=143232 RepID=A0AAF0YI95_9TREE|nr:GYF domain-containing protein mpd2 [Vanrija pseudolonga]